MRSRANLGVAGVTVIVIGCAVGGYWWHRSHTGRADLARAAVSVVRLEPEEMRGPLSFDDPAGVASWTILESPSPLPAGVADEARSIAQDEATSHPGSSRCFRPGFAIHFDDGTVAEDWIVCLHCGAVEVFSRGKFVEQWKLSQTGADRLTRLYASAFPAHAAHKP